jgi:hypothetical protein
MCRSSPGPRVQLINNQHITSITFPVEEIATIFAREGDTLWKFTHELDDLSYMIVVFAVPRTGRGIEKIVATR